ncbi:MAG: indolepyruvate ferredoxin oxidoreductase subunit alpha [Christensenellaceae bacterium]|nr:indolepyruvate ferredoxin oxidoreductase subunit alpha [Christensenellaceae bacterium]
MASVVLQPAGHREVLMGNEAIARGAVEAGLQLMAAYPGTPSSEVGEVLLSAAPESDYYVEWSLNEKVAFEVAAGAALTGARTLCAMKNAGLNVAMDTFMTLPYGGVKGGMVVVVADDPDAHYSSNEQDTRLLAAYAEIPCLEPENQQEAKDMTKAAFALSEDLELPVMLRSVSRISHASGDVLFGEARAERNEIGFNKHYEMPYRWDVYGPPGAVNKHKWLHTALVRAQAKANESPFNTLVKPKGAKLGVLATGLGAAYAKEALNRLGVGDDVAFLKLGMVFPFADKLAKAFLQGLDTVLVIEEGDPLCENFLRALAQEDARNVKIFGKGISRIFEPYGELNTDIVTAAIAPYFGAQAPAAAKEAIRQELAKLVIPRSSTLCAGCSHLGTYCALRTALSAYPEDAVHIVNGDIGCYEQAGYGIFGGDLQIDNSASRRYQAESPYDVLDTLYVMGSGISMAHGQSKLGYDKGKLVAVCGDSTFFHAILPALANAVYNHSNICFLVLDNRWTCMTGHQPNPTTGLDAYAQEYPRMEILPIIKAMGVEFVRTADAYQKEDAVSAIADALAFEGPAVVVMEGECQLQRQRRVKKTMAKTYVNAEACSGCKTCVQLGCPATRFNAAEKKAGIDGVLCVDCGLCQQYCTENAIRVRRR